MTFSLKPSETLSWSVVDDSGDISGATIEAALAAADFYYPLTVTPIDLTLGQYELSANNTSSFPIGTLSCDIRYTVGSIVTFTETFYVEVVEGITE